MIKLIIVIEEGVHGTVEETYVKIVDETERERIILNSIGDFLKSEEHAKILLNKGKAVSVSCISRSL